MQVKPCKTCTQILPTESFSKGQGKYKKLNVCKPCDADRRRNDYHSLSDDKRLAQNKRQRIYDYKRVYNLSQELAEQLTNSREGVCKICNETKLLIVDHCHTSGKVRGLICSHCNSVLGYARDSINILQNAITYLNKGEENV